MALHVEIAERLAADAALGLPPLRAIGVAAARLRAEQRERPKGPAVGAVETVAIPLADTSLAARVYRPVGAGATMPAVVFVHGGGWVTCSLDTHDNICRHLCAGGHVVVVSLGYRMAPEHPFPGPLDDVLAGLRHVAEHAAAFGIDPKRMVMAGDSAGGNLVAAAALRLRDAGALSYAAQMLLYPVTDHYSADFPSYRRFAEGCGLTADEMVWFWDLYAPTPDLYLHPDAAPLRAADLSGLPPTYVMTAECDVLRDEAEAYAERLSAAGVVVSAHRFEGLNHGCAGSFGALSCVDPFRRHLLDWLAAILAPV